MHNSIANLQKKKSINWNTHKAIIIYKFLIVMAITISQQATAQEQDLKSAYDVIERVVGKSFRNKINIDYSKAINKNSYSYEVNNGKLNIKASNTTSATRAVYDYLRNNHFGMLDWAGNNFKIPKKLPDSKIKFGSSPFKIRQAYNVVTFGYTTPYWTWERWEQELDWQAMHGFNMLMAPVASEAIFTRVWKKLGLTQSEIDDFYVGPSLLPWQRMGNIQSVGGTLPQEWHTDQITLQHKILNRMHQLGMQPIVPSFAGFVPKAIKRIYPNLQLHKTLWNSGFPESQRPVMLMPGDKLFSLITKLYIEEWNKEFGNATYYLVDSFNELELPETDKPKTELLAEYGKFTYDAIKAAQPNAIWVIQGWMFGYQRQQWPPENVKALFSQVPNNKVLILDYANDYANSWEPVNGFNGKQWVYGFVPNMGGKTAYTGDLNLYATGAAKTLNNDKKNNLVGFSISGEGLENNTVVYELLADAAWSHEPIDLSSWLKHYSLNRYGSYDDNIKKSWELLLESSYKNLIDHPQFNWQLGKFNKGSVHNSKAFKQSVYTFFKSGKKLKNQIKYKEDLIERIGLLIGLVADEQFVKSQNYLTMKDTLNADKHFEIGIQLLKNLDFLYQSHPTHRLDRWLNFASAHSNNLALKNFYISNAKRIITVWGPPVNDYSCRVWSGLIRDFYIPRMETMYTHKKLGKELNKNEYELNWVQNPKWSKGTEINNIYDYCHQILEYIRHIDN